MRHTILTLAFCLAGPAVAQDDLKGKYGTVLEACFGAATSTVEGEACISRMFEACAQGEPGGQSTVGTIDCARAEAEIWDKHLNIEYKATRAQMRQDDKAELRTFPEFARRAEALLAAQRAWIAFRDAECDLVSAQFGAGSLSRVSASLCVMQMTAERTFELRAYRGGF
ncbi:MAG: lysozyme inhibitor LprI family protein [Silicimonas sp.]|nr:lysozyme inhibitor LprI family protein [Silicimonas sp.]